MLSRCSASELDLDTVTGEVGMDRDVRPGSSFSAGGASLSLDGRLRASLESGGGAKTLWSA